MLLYSFSVSYKRRSPHRPFPSGLPGASLQLENLRFRAVQGSVWTITSAISGRSRRIRSSISLARECASSSLLVPSSASVRNATSPSSVRRKRSSRGGLPVSSSTTRATTAAPSASDLARLALLRERLEVRLHAGDLGHGGADRRLEVLGDRVRLLEREVAGKLDVQRELGVPVDLDERQVVHLAHARARRPRPRARARAGPRPRRAARRARRRPRSAARASRRPRPRRRPRAPGRRPLRARRRSRRRRTGARRPAASAAAAARRRAASPRSPTRAAASASAGARSISTSTLQLDQPRRREQHEHADEERRDRVAVRVPGGGEAEADQHGDRACEVAAEVERVRGERGAAVAARGAPRDRHAARVDRDHDRRARRTRTRPSAPRRCVAPVRRSIARTEMKMLTSASAAASASAERCSALPWPN